jgi:hypothetical protein
MAYVKKTLADLKQSLADRHDGGTLPTDSATLTFWTRLLNKGVAYCTDRLRLLKEATVTVSSGSGSLPDDFIVMNKVYDADENEYYMVDPDNVSSRISSAYWITGNHQDGFTLKTDDDDTFTIEYAFRPAEMTSDSDECIIPDPEAVVAYAYAYLRKSETDPLEDAESALRECDSRLAEVQDAYGLNNNLYGFSLQSNS